MKRLEGSTVWWLGTASDLEETGREAPARLPGTTCPWSWPWAVTKHGQASSLRAPDLLRGRASGLWSAPFLKVSEGSYLHLKSCFGSNSGFSTPGLLDPPTISTLTPAEYQKSEYFG